MHAYLTANITVGNKGGWLHYNTTDSTGRHLLDTPVNTLPGTVTKKNSGCSNSDTHQIHQKRVIPQSPSNANAFDSFPTSKQYSSTNLVLLCYNWSPTVPE
jgi:hypothetical protein